MRTAKAEAKAEAAKAEAATERRALRSLPILLRHALDLSEEQRLELASELIASVDGPPDDNWDSQWLEELDRRLLLLQKEPERGDDWSRVKQRVLSRLGR